MLRDYLGQSGQELKAFCDARGETLHLEDNYIHAIFDSDGKAMDAYQSGYDEAGYQQNGVKGFLKDRKNHNLKPVLSVDFFISVNSSLAMTDNYICTSDLVDTFHGVMANTHAREAINYAMGQGRVNQLIEWVNLIDRGGMDVGAAMVSSGKFISMAQSAKAVGLLGYRLLTLIKQTSAIFNPVASGRIKLSSLIFELCKVFVGQGKFTLVDMMKSDAIKSRMRSHPILDEVLMLTPEKHYTGFRSFAQAGMIPMAFVDKFVNAFSACAMANHAYAQQQKTNEKFAGTTREMSEEVMTRNAMLEAEIAIELAAQPLKANQQSGFAAKGGVLARMLCFMGGETLNKIGNIITQVEKGNYVGAVNTYMTFSITEQLIMAFYNYIIDPPEEGEEAQFWATYGLGTLLGLPSTMPLVGNATQGALYGIDKMSGTHFSKYYSSYGNEVLPVTSAIMSTYKLTQWDEDATSTQMTKDVINLLNTLASFAGIGSASNVKYIAYVGNFLMASAAAKNSIRDIIKYLDAREE